MRSRADSQPACATTVADPLERALLARLLAGPVSGAELAAAAGVTRAAVWKRVEALRAQGVDVEARAGTGYSVPAGLAALGLLDPDAIRAAAGAALHGRLDALRVAWSIDSTSSALLRDAQAGDGSVLLAERQSGGRGRRGRAWASPLAAHVYLSLLRRFELPPVRLGGLSIVVGIACAHALRGFGFGQVGLKWPNDVVVVRDGVLHKLGGILVEFGGEAGGPVRAVIGIGINGRMPTSVAATLDQPWTDLATLAAGAPPSRSAVAGAVLACLVPALDRFAQEGLAPFLEAYAGLDVLAGQAVTMLGGARTDEGVACGIGEDGALRVRHATGIRAWHSGEVSVRLAGVT
ncbi:biotin--[acetyl-CoA-carboxylase] ligase [Coralloluteibacterium stylophorae]|uniref:Bifunctional ligase/repressor BirA n=1 Tax=Coralloluteibacterium stylophorae TaxID=1776034 RepID=A0A8J7VW42_9GAMM|nr:biotin--[acetyl-CoA-carboxylase] ligase [Coralloluteibacterium stylophorae]MBS7458207.1 biotin--[acetyl-CoA-carboxylase] ligase [Coralloluteibacterium stylophorae]